MFRVLSNLRTECLRLGAELGICVSGSKASTRAASLREEMKGGLGRTAPPGAFTGCASPFALPHSSPGAMPGFFLSVPPWPCPLPIPSEFSNAGHSLSVPPPWGSPYAFSPYAAFPPGAVWNPSFVQAQQGPHPQGLPQGRHGEALESHCDKEKTHRDRTHRERTGQGGLGFRHEEGEADPKKGECLETRPPSRLAALLGPGSFRGAALGLALPRCCVFSEKKQGRRWRHEAVPVDWDG